MRSINKNTFLTGSFMLGGFTSGVIIFNKIVTPEIGYQNIFGALVMLILIWGCLTSLYFFIKSNSLATKPSTSTSSSSEMTSTWKPSLDGQYCINTNNGRKISHEEVRIGRDEFSFDDHDSIIYLYKCRRCGNTYSKAICRRK